MRLKIWLLVNVLVSFLGTVSFAIINFLLWEKNKSLDLILHFNFYLFLTLLVGCLIAGFISFIVGAKVSFCLSILFKIAALAAAAIFSDNLSNYIFLIAILLGLNYAFYFTSGSIIT